MSTTFNLFRTKHTSYDNCKTFEEESELVFDEQFTANYGSMAEECGLADVIWKPYEISPLPCAFHVVPLLKDGIELLKLKPQHFKDLEPSNYGGGTYTQFLESCEKVLEACEKFPQARIFCC
tara:strand:+ start:113 stop:478 length:366 start_codon:yes stop_codon:yes gene_type:complete